MESPQEAKEEAQGIDPIKAGPNRKMNVADAEPLNMAMPTPPASPVHEADARAEDSTPPSPAEPSAAAEQHQTPPPSPPVILVSSHTTTTNPATTPAAPAEPTRGRTPEMPLGSTPSSSSPSPPAPAQSEEAGPLQYMLLRSQLQRIEARQLHFQNEVKVFQENLIKFLSLQFPASAEFFGQTSTPPPQPSASAAAAAQPSTHMSAKQGATEEVHFLSDDENDIFDWQSPRDHLLTISPSTSTPTLAAPILSATPTPTTAAAVERPTPDSPTRKRGKATAGRTLGRDTSSEEEAVQRPDKRRRRYHIITAESDDDGSDAEVPAVLGLHHMRQKNQLHFKECMIQGLCENSMVSQKRFSRRLKDHVFRDTHTQKPYIPWQYSPQQELSNPKDVEFGRLDALLREATYSMDNMLQQSTHWDTKILMKEVKEQCLESSPMCGTQLEPPSQEHVNEKECSNELQQRIAMAMIEEHGQSNMTTHSEAETSNATAKSEESDAKNEIATLMLKHEFMNCSYQ
ncbi:hypothetical protein GQ457_10G009590 [Hibiscus cannabinus]